MEINEYNKKITAIIENIGKDNTEIISRISGYENILSLNEKDPTIKDVLKTNFILLLYSCFEGMIKNTTDNFFNFLKEIKSINKNIKFIDKYHYIILFNECCHNGNDSKDFIKSFSESIFTIYDTQQIIFDIVKLKVKTQSNLKYHILIAILYILNIKTEKFINFGEISIKEKLNEFVDKRNQIAHGDISYIKQIENIITDEELEVYKEMIKYLIETFKEEIDNILIEEKFLIQENL